MNYRTRFINTLEGRPVDRLPLIEIGKYSYARRHSRWHEHIGPDGDPRVLLGLDNVVAPHPDVPYEFCPIDWYAQPPFETRTFQGPDGYLRAIDARFGRTSKVLPAGDDQQETRRIHDRCAVVTREDWQEYKQRFHLTAEGRFPADWPRWCEHSRTAGHPIVLFTPGLVKTVYAVMGLDGDQGLLLSLYDRPEFVKEIVDHFAELTCICAEKALQEAKVDMVLFYDDPVGSKGPMVGPDTMREFFLGATARLVQLAHSYGVETVMLRPRGDIRALFDGYVQSGINGLGGLEDHANVHLADMLDTYGTSVCFVGGIDCRTLLGSFEDIEREVDCKVRLARKGRVVPCLSAMVYPEVEYPKYAHYVKCLRKAILS